MANKKPEEPKEERKLQPFNAAKLDLVQSAFNSHWFPVPFGVSLEEAIQPALWAHAAPKLMIRDRIWLEADDGSWDALTKVLDKTSTSVTLVVLSFVQHEVARDKDVVEGVEIRYTASDKYTLIDGDKTVGKDIATRNQAVIERAKYIDRKAA